MKTAHRIEFATVLIVSLASVSGCDESALSSHSADAQSRRQDGPPPPPTAQTDDVSQESSSAQSATSPEGSGTPVDTNRQDTDDASSNSSSNASRTNAGAEEGSAGSRRESQPVERPRSDSDYRQELRVDVFGVALAQTLPTGSAMGFSVEYQLLAGRLDPSARYAWVIEHPQGQVWRHQVNLESRGELSTFVTQWPPFNGTYTTYLEEHRGSQSIRVISKRLPLVYAY